MKKQIIANTFTPLYDEVEDRLRLTINYQDIQNRIDFMITRSFILNLAPAADEFIEKHYQDELIIQDNITINPEENQNEIIENTDSVNLELLKTAEELLIEVNFAFDVDTKNTAITFASKNSVAKVLLDASTMQQTFKVIKSAIPYMKWGISYHF